MHDAADSAVVEGFDCVHRGAIVPHNDIVLGPDMPVDEAVFRSVRDDLVQQGAAVIFRQTFDPRHGVW